MTTFINCNQAKVMCACRNNVPIYMSYFCRYCIDIRCRECVSHEVDAYNCPSCMESMAGAEAKMRKHRCPNCHNCPCCGNNVNVKATMTYVPSPEDPKKNNPQKVYFLSCGFCRWSTKDVNIENKLHPSGSWVESANPHDVRIEELIEQYRQMAIKEKNEQEKSKFTRKRNYMMLMSRYPVLTPSLRRYCTSYHGTSDEKELEITEVDNQPPIVLKSSEATGDVPTFDVEEFLEKNSDINKVTSIFQRHLVPHRQPVSVEELEPRNQRLMVKRSMRCRRCEHNLSKADYNPSSIKFRINSSALYHLPDLRILPPPGVCETVCLPMNEETDPIALLNHNRSHPPGLGKLNPRVIRREAKPGVPSEVVLVLSNPTDRLFEVSLRQLTVVEEHSMLTTQSLSPTAHVAKLQPGEEAAAAQAVDEEATSAIAEPSVIQEDAEQAAHQAGRPHSNVTLEFSSKPITLAAKVDPALTDTLSKSSSQNDFNDDEKFVAFRKLNKVGVKVSMTPDKELAKSEFNQVPLKAAVQITFVYKSTNTRSLMSEQKAAFALQQAKKAFAAAAVAKDDPSKAPTTAPSSTMLLEPSEQLFDVSYTALLDLGDMLLS